MTFPLFQRRNQRSGFTVVELLIVIAIVTMLIALLLPALNKARTAVIRIQCASNLRQIGAAVAMYISSNQGIYPAVQPPGLGVSEYWWSTLSPYLGANASASTAQLRVLQCPVQTMKVEGLLGSYWETQPSYGMSFQLGANSSNVSVYSIRVKATQVRNPSEKIMCSEASFNASTVLTSLTSGGMYQAACDGYPLLSYEGGVHPKQTSNILWCDGHVDGWQDVERLNLAPYWLTGSKDVWTP